VTIFKRVQGDINDTAVTYLYGVATFSGTAEAHVWQPNVTAITLAAVVVNGVDPYGVACGVCTVSLGSSSGWLKTATPGNWHLEYQVTFADSSVLTWPADAPDQISVRPQGG
jgi:hypothetical protein